MKPQAIYSTCWDSFSTLTLVMFTGIFINTFNTIHIMIERSVHVETEFWTLLRLCQQIQPLFYNWPRPQWGSVNHQMAEPVPSISCCVFNNNDFFYQEPNELAFIRDTCCHLVICLRLIASHWTLALIIKTWHWAYTASVVFSSVVLVYC